MGEISDEVPLEIYIFVDLNNFYTIIMFILSTIKKILFTLQKNKRTDKLKQLFIISWFLLLIIIYLLYYLCWYSSVGRATDS